MKIFSMYINIWPDNWQAKVRCQLKKLITAYKKINQAKPPADHIREALFFHVRVQSLVAFRMMSSGTNDTTFLCLSIYLFAFVSYQRFLNKLLI